jgi:hypothetical protein
MHHMAEAYGRECSLPYILAGIRPEECGGEPGD